MKLLDGWDDCARCPRQERRLGVLAVDWGRRPRVLVLDGRALKSSQAVPAPSPRLEAFGRELATRLGLDPEDVQVDVLVACGLGYELPPDHVAACAQRFALNQRKYGDPDVVVLRGQRVEAMALGAGLLVTHRVWQPLGVRGGVPVVVANDAEPSQSVAKEVAEVLNTRARSLHRPTNSAAEKQAKRMLELLGPVEGSATRALLSGPWKRRPSQVLNEGLVFSHLRAIKFVAPFRPRRREPDEAGLEWRLVVIDVDRHDAIQAANFNETLRKIRKSFPQSLYVQSSSAGGVHVYIRIPDGVSYEEGAAWLRTFFAVKDLLFVDSGKKKAGRKKVVNEPSVVRAQRLEVPGQPVRLPFGRGSNLLDYNPLSLTQAVDVFEDFVLNDPTEEFERARAEVRKALNISAGTKWSTVLKFKLRKFIDQRETEGMRPERLPLGDPWLEVLPDLSKPLRVVASGGVPAMGTRTRWTTALIDALFDLVEPDRVLALMKHWLWNRPHVSEDIESDITGVEDALVKAVENKKKRLVGVPVRVWEQIEASIEGRISRLLRPSEWAGTSLSHHDKIDPEVLLPKNRRAVLRTAFFIARKFFEKATATVAIPRREFHRFLDPKHTASVEKLLTRGTWLTMTAPQIYGVRARKYALPADQWPAEEGEPMLFVMPRGRS